MWGTAIVIYRNWRDSKISNELADEVIKILRKCDSPKEASKILSAHKEYLINKDPDCPGALLKVYGYYVKKFGGTKPKLKAYFF